MSDFVSIRLSVSGADEQDLDSRIAVLSAAFPVGTLVTVTRGTVFNRHGMPPSCAALLSVRDAARRGRLNRKPALRALRSP
jgi:hypothetical protein